MLKLNKYVKYTLCEVSQKILIQYFVLQRRGKILGRHKYICYFGESAAQPDNKKIIVT